jgi:hypothetical protein
MYFGIAAIDLQLLDSGCLLEFTYIKRFHLNDYIISNVWLLQWKVYHQASSNNISAIIRNCPPHIEAPTPSRTDPINSPSIEY